MNYDNKSKLERAKKWAKEQGKENDEETIKARYLVLGGLITGSAQDEVGGAVEDSEEDKPRRGRKPKNEEED